MRLLRLRLLPLRVSQRQKLLRNGLRQSAQMWRHWALKLRRIRMPQKLPKMTQRPRGIMLSSVKMRRSFRKMLLWWQRLPQNLLRMMLKRQNWLLRRLRRPPKQQRLMRRMPETRQKYLKQKPLQALSLLSSTAVSRPSRRIEPGGFGMLLSRSTSTAESAAIW